MSQEQEYSQEILNAFVDGQLSLEARIRLYARLQRDEALNRRVCELCMVRDLVRRAYEIPPKRGQDDLIQRHGIRSARYGLSPRSFQSVR